MKTRTLSSGETLCSATDFVVGGRGGRHGNAMRLVPINPNLDGQPVPDGADYFRRRVPAWHNERDGFEAKPLGPKQGD